MLASCKGAATHVDLPTISTIHGLMGPPEDAGHHRRSPKLHSMNFAGGGRKISTVDIAATCSAAVSDAHRQFDFWTEEENTRFVNAIDSFQFPPDINAIAACMGSKGVEQTNSYAALYIEALTHHRGVAMAQGKLGNLHIAAADVYNYHGIGSIYSEFKRNQGRLSSDSATSSAASSASTERPPSKGISIDFLCGTPDNAPEQCTTDHVMLQQRLTPPSVLSGHMLSQQEGASTHHMLPFMDSRHGFPPSPQLQLRHLNAHHVAQLYENGANNGHYAHPQPGHSNGCGGEGQSVPDVGSMNGAGVASGGGGGERGGSIWQGEGASILTRPVKRKRPEVEEKTMEEMHEEIQKMIVPAETLWQFSAMDEHAVRPKDNDEPKNPWEWCRKVIAKTNGYSQWIGLFSENILLSKREVSDDMRIIRIKAPPPPPQVEEVNNANPYSRKMQNSESKKGVARKAVAAAEAPSKLQRVTPANRRAASDVDGDEAALAKRPKASPSEGLQVGNHVEVKWEGEWWEATIKKLRMTADKAKQQAFVSYVGGTEEEDEWIPMARIRVPKSARDSSPPSDKQPKAKGQGRWPNRGEKEKKAANGRTAKAH